MAKFSVEQTLRRAKLHAQKGELAKARELYAVVLEKFPQNKKAKVALANLAAKAPSKANVSLPAQTAKLLVDLLNQGQFKRVIAETQRLCRVFPESHFLWNIQGVAYHRSGDFAAAVLSFHKACRLNPSFPEAFNNLGLSLIASGREGEAIGPFQKAIEIKPDYVDALNNLGSLYSKQGRLSDATKAFEKSEELGSKSPDAKSDFGLALLQQGRFDRAIARLKASLDLVPDNARFLNNLGSAYDTMGNYELAVSYYLQAIKVDPDFESSHYNLAKLPIGALTDDIIKILKEFTPKSDPELLRPKSQFFQANLLRHQRKTEDSFKYLCHANESSFDFVKVEEWKQSMTETEANVKLWQPTSVQKNDHIRPKLLFVLGPSRSGKSTIERMIANSEKVLRSDEGWRGNTAIRNLKERVSVKEAKSAHIPGATIGDILHISETDLVAQGAQILVCTNHDILRSANLIHDVYENAYFLFVGRDAIEAASEIFAKEYNSGNWFSYNAETALEYVEWYNRVTEVLNEKMGDRAAFVNFDDVLSNPRKLVAIVEKLLGERLFSETQTFEKKVNRPAPYATYFKELLDKNNGDGRS